jgi:iron complex transport system permease protein
MTGHAIVASARTARRRRERIVIAILAVIVVIVGLVSISIGGYTVSLPNIAAALVGRGTERDEFIVVQLRLPRVVIAILTGIAFALAGALFQSLLHNPLASPDIIGITGGASAAAVVAILVFGLSGLAVSGAAFAGGLAVASVIYLLSWRAGISGNRFVLIGIGFSFLVQSILGYLLTRADVRDAQSALVWLVGSLSGTTWTEIAMTALALAVLLPLVGAFAPRLAILQLGDDSANGLGVPAGRTRLALIIVGVALAAVGTAVVGPIAFVAFVSAPLARQLVGTGGLALVPSALVGAILVSTSDFVGQHLLPGDSQVPVGVLTGAIGAPYLLWLLASRNRSRGSHDHGA